MVSNSNPDDFVEPRNIDVLCGRGMVHFKHPGNQTLRSMIVEQIDDYRACTLKREKTSIVRGVISVVMKGGGRFLKYDSVAQAWYDGGIATAKVRVGVGFRDAKAPNKVRYVKKMQAAALLSVNVNGYERDYEPIHPKQKPLHPSRTASSSLMDLVLRSPPIENLQSGSKDAADQAMTTSLPILEQQTSIGKRETTLDAWLEPSHVDDKQNIGVTTAQYLMDALSRDVSNAYCDTSEEDTALTYSDTLDEIEPIDQKSLSDERFIADFIRSNELFLDDFLHTISTVDVFTLDKPETSGKKIQASCADD